MDVMTRIKALPDINAIARPLSESDKACFSEVAEVLRKHGCIERFGLTLLHEHFPVNDDEVLYEEHDPVNRRLTLFPVKNTENSMAGLSRPAGGSIRPALTASAILAARATPMDIPDRFTTTPVSRTETFGRCRRHHL